jgi:hypothetical protein
VENPDLHKSDFVSCHLLYLTGGNLTTSYRRAPTLI